MSVKKHFLFKAVLFLLLMLSLAFANTPGAQARPAPQAAPVHIYFFWGNGCPHCAEAEPFLDSLERKYSRLEVYDFEVWYNDANQRTMQEMSAKFGFEPSAVPMFFIGDKYWMGFSENIGAQLEEAVKSCLSAPCPDAGVGIIPGIEAPVDVTEGSVGDTADTLTLPLVGTVDLGQQSLAVSTALIAFVDGFNPCSLWVLSILLALTLHTGSRKKVLIIGFVFLTVTSLVYVLFIAGLFTLFTVISFLEWIQAAIALLALFFAAVNIKDYFWYKEGISFTIDDEKKPGIYKSIRRVMAAGDSLWGLLTATVAMSAGVSLVEFSCTAGFPVLWTNLLAAQAVSPTTFALLLALYMAIYQLDELGIFLAAVFTLKASKLEEKHGRILKLIGGMLMLTLAVVMLVNPAAMNKLSNSLLIFAAAFGAALLVLFVHRVILPGLGIHIGTEELSGTAKKRKRKQQKRAQKRAA